MKSNDKIKTHFARIVVGTSTGTPYYNIIYFDPKDMQYHIGFGSYCLDNVSQWLEEEFEIPDDPFLNEPVMQSKWEFAGDGIVSCKVCNEAYNNTLLPRNFCPNCGARMHGDDEELRYYPIKTSQPRLIDVDDAIEKINGLCVDGNENWIGTDNQSFVDHSEVIDILCDAPTVDAVPVVHGEWLGSCFIKVQQDKYPAVNCSNCGCAFCDVINNHHYMYHYCPHCGAKMDGGNKNG